MVIDAALEALCIENEDWNTVSSQYGTFWFHKRRFTGRNSDWVTARFMKPVITIINTGAHWVFLAIDVANAEVFIYDPLGRENTIAPTITTNLTSFQKFYNMKLHKLNASYEDAKVVIHSHNIKQDTHSCGPLSIMYACDQCCRWIHESCSAEPAENEQFLCKHCTI
ncbi:unnamed protein product [Clavelina lepadiformis]|uniref:Ubiquitin-like protease family profile domain-containing protein n=2 Tax=Clavelina lepadiformis TaxID=159417 RepID=A0ABP0GRY0_CLALP